MTAAALALASGCWPGWTALLNPSPSREHRVEDLRVLAVELEPASLIIPAAFAFGDDSGEVEPVRFVIRPRIFDPRGGALSMGVALCAAPEEFAPCVDGGLQLTQREVDADADAPLGAVDVELDVRLDRKDMAALARAAGTAWPSLQPLFLRAAVSVSRTVDDIEEKELAELPFLARVDPLGAEVTPDALRSASLMVCPSLDFDLQCGGLPLGSCGDGAIDPAESCDPPEEDVCDENCRQLDLCPTHLPLVCARPAFPNTRPRLVGLSRGDAPLRDGAAEFAPGARISVARGELVTLAPVLSSADEEERPRVLPVSGRVVDDGDGNSEIPAPCPLHLGYSCLGVEELTTRFYVGAGGLEIVAPDDGSGTGTYVGNGNGGALFAITVRVDEDAGAETLLVVLQDGDGGMDVAAFTLDAR